MSQLKAIQTPDDIPQALRDTPIGDLLAYHNLGKPFKSYAQAQILIGMCMDNRKQLNLPQNFAFTLRTGGANLKDIEFKVSFAISVGGIRHIALIGHTQCGMMNLADKKDKFIQGLVDGAGWNASDAEKHFEEFSPVFETGNTEQFIVLEAKRIQEKYPKIQVAPLMYKVEDNLLYSIETS